MKKEQSSEETRVTRDTGPWRLLERAGPQFTVWVAAFPITNMSIGIA